MWIAAIALGLVVAAFVIIIVFRRSKRVSINVEIKREEGDEPVF